MQNDPELNAMSNLIEVLNGMDTGQVRRILDWATSRFGLDELMKKQDEEAAAFGLIPISGQVPVVQQIPTAPIKAATTVAPVTLTTTIGQPVHPAPVAEPTAETGESSEDEADSQQDIDPSLAGKEDTKIPSTKGLGFKRFKNIENLFLGANIKSIGSRILLAAAYIQEKEGFEEMSSYDINSRLKKLGYGVSNITTAINTLLKKKPPQMAQTKKEGTSKQAKRKFIITPEGLELAKTYLKSANE